MKTLYLANPYGFSDSAKRLCLDELKCCLLSLGAIILEPFERNNQIDFADEHWAYKIGQADLYDVRDSQGIFAVLNGNPPDEGVCVELGYAIALNKPIFLYRDDFRRCTDSEQYPLNLMLFSGLPFDTWKDYYYTSIYDLKNPQKALYQWLKNG